MILRRWLASVRTRLRAAAAERELDDELRTHLEMAVEENCVFQRKWNTDFSRSGTSISEEVEHRFREVEHGFRDVEHAFRGKWNAGSGVVNARR